MVERSPLLAPLVERVTEDQLDFANGTTFAAFPCSSRGGRGWPIFTLVLDEAAHFVDTEGVAAAEPVYRALSPATAQFGDLARIVISSTPWGSSGFFADTFQRADSGELGDAYAHHATTAEANPTIDPEFLESEQRRDPESYRSEYAAEFIGSGGAFFDAEYVQACVRLPSELNHGDALDWIVGLDPAFSSDPFAAVLVGRDPRDRKRLLVGAVRSWLPPRRKARSLDESRETEDAVLTEVAGLIKLFGARAISDHYRSAGVAERLKRHGIYVTTEPMTAVTKDAAFGYLRGRFNEGSIDLFEHTDLLRELRAVRTRYAAGRSSIVLPRIGGSHCDLAQALALAVFAHDRYGMGSGELTIEVGGGERISERNENGTFGLSYDMAFL